MSLTFNSSNIVLRACHVSGTMLDAKISDVTKTGGPCPHGSSILVGEMGVNLKTWYTMERLFPVWQAKAQMGNEELRLGADGPPLRTGG